MHSYTASYCGLHFLLSGKMESYVLIYMYISGLCWYVRQLKATYFSEFVVKLIRLVGIRMIIPLAPLCLVFLPSLVCSYSSFRPIPPYFSPSLPSFLMTQSYSLSVSPAVWHSQSATATQLTPLFCVWTYATSNAHTDSMSCVSQHCASVASPPPSTPTNISPIYKTYVEVMGCFYFFLIFKLRYCHYTYYRKDVTGWFKVARVQWS